FLSEVGEEAKFKDTDCAFHTLKAVYEFYGHNFESTRLKKRLGLECVSQPRGESKSKGALHPELLKVLTEDGFYFDSLCLDLPEKKIVKKLQKHLCKGNMAIVLLRRKYNGNMHWVALRNSEKGQIAIIDC